MDRQAGRLGDKAKVPSDAHGCPACPHTAEGPAVTASEDVYINQRPVLRVGDAGVHDECCGANVWRASAGASEVYVNNRRVHRKGDATSHCGGDGELIEGSEDVIIGDAGGGGGASGGGGVWV